MRNCASSVSDEKTRAFRGEFDAFADRWNAEERTSARESCEPWAAELRALESPECADDSTFVDLSFEDILQASRAVVALQAGALEPRAYRPTADALLSAAEALFSLARGNTAGLIVGVAAHFAGGFDRWVAWTDARTPALQERRKTLQGQLPSAAHRWQVHRDRTRELRKQTSKSSFEGHAFVLIDAPRFTDDTFDMKRVAPEVWDTVIDDLQGVRCKADWESCTESLDSVGKGYIESVDPKLVRKLFWSSPGAYSELEEPQREAVEAWLRSRAADFFLVSFKMEHAEIEKLRAEWESG